MNHATREAIRATRIYCSDGAKALAPLLDDHRPPRTHREWVMGLLRCRMQAEETGDARAALLLTVLGRLYWKQFRSVWEAYRGVWEVGPDGEPRRPPETFVGDGGSL